MSDYKQFLVAIDFSDAGNVVIKQARHLAERFHAELSAIHVLDNIPMPDTPYGTIITLDAQSSDELLEAEKNKFNAVCDDWAIEVDKRWLIWGKPEEEITQLASSQGIDLIIVGSHGRHGLAVLMDSTAKGVIFNAQCDVLTVHLQPNQ